MKNTFTEVSDSDTPLPGNTPPLSNLEPNKLPSRLTELPAGNTATGWLKLIALIFMFIDHAGKMLFPLVQEWRMLGRIAFPLYAWCLVVGFCYTRSVGKYLLRLLTIGLISQPLYMLALNHPWYEPNILFTMALGLCGLWAVREKRFCSHVWGPVLVLLLSCLLGTDYSWKGILFIMFLYACRGKRSALAALMISYFLFWGSGYKLITSLCGLSLDLSAWPTELASIPKALLRMETFGLLSLPLILFPFPKCMQTLHLPKWLGYGIYPLHLLLLIGIELICGVISLPLL